MTKGSWKIDFLSSSFQRGPVKAYASYVLVYGSFVYFVPLTVTVHSYYHIFKRPHSSPLEQKERQWSFNCQAGHTYQRRKGIEHSTSNFLSTLRTDQSQDTTSNLKVAFFFEKMASMKLLSWTVITHTLALSFTAWTPYLMYNCLVVYGSGEKLTTIKCNFPPHSTNTFTQVQV